MAEPFNEAIFKMQTGFFAKFGDDVGKRIINEVNSLIQEAFYKGAATSSPPFPPDAERIRELEVELVRVGRDAQWWKKQFDEINAAAGGKGIHWLKKSLDPKRIQALEDEITRIRQDNQTDRSRLQRIIEDQRLKIKGYQADTTTEEGAFIIAQQYEREFTSVGHLNQTISDLNAEVESLKYGIEKQNRKVTNLQNQLDAEGARVMDLERQLADEKKRSETLERLGNYAWRKYQDERAGHLTLPEDEEEVRQAFLKAAEPLREEKEADRIERLDEGIFI